MPVSAVRKLTKATVENAVVKLSVKIANSRMDSIYKGALISL